MISSYSKEIGLSALPTLKAQVLEDHNAGVTKKAPSQTLTMSQPTVSDKELLWSKQTLKTQTQASEEIVHSFYTLIFWSFVISHL